MLLHDSLATAVIIHSAAPDVGGFVTALKAFIAPIFMLAVGIVALTFLMKRQMTQFLQFFGLTILIGVLFYYPGIIEGFAGWAAGLFFGGVTPK